MKTPIYVYDRSEQLKQPVFVVYEEDHVEKVAVALFGHFPETLYVTRVAEHEFDRQPFRHTGEQKNQNRRSHSWR